MILRTSKVITEASLCQLQDLAPAHLCLVGLEGDDSLLPGSVGALSDGIAEEDHACLLLELLPAIGEVVPQRPFLVVR